MIQPHLRLIYENKENRNLRKTKEAAHENVRDCGRHPDSQLEYHWVLYRDNLSG